MNLALSENPLKAAIEAQMASDQGTLFRQWSQYYLPLMDDAYRPHEDDGLRTHLGASLIGDSCVRKLFYTFRWFKTPRHTGRLLRLFNRGHLEEARFLAMLACVGVDIYPQHPETGKQFRIQGSNGHYGGALDGLGRNVPGLGEQWVSFEMKTHGEKSFAGVKSKGVRKSKPIHYTQMQQGMGYYKLQYCVYMAVNKNTDELYVEFVPFDKTNYRMYSERPSNIIQTDSVPVTPPRLNNASLSYFECKFCDYSDICFSQDKVPEGVRFGCRTCQCSVPVDGAKWFCSKQQLFLDKQQQLDGCQAWEPIRD